MVVGRKTGAVKNSAPCPTESTWVIAITAEDIVTAADFKAAQIRLGFTNAAMADLLRVTVTYVEMLRAGTRTASGTVQRVIEQAEELKQQDSNQGGNK